MLKVDRSGAHPTWTGMEGRSGREVPLDDVWVHDNFAPWFIQNVTDCFKHVPAGKAAASPEHRVAQTGLFGGFDLGGVPVGVAAGRQRLLRPLRRWKYWAEPVTSPAKMAERKPPCPGAGGI